MCPELQDCDFCWTNIKAEALTETFCINSANRGKKGRKRSMEFNCKCLQNRKEHRGERGRGVSYIPFNEEAF